jgi:hypothetical protein
MIFLMDTPEVRQDVDLSSWDWMATLKAEERSLRWLARKTGRSGTTLHRYARGTLPTPVGFLRQAAAALKIVAE